MASSLGCIRVINKFSCQQSLVKLFTEECVTVHVDVCVSAGVQQPTLSDMTQYELNFSLLVEQMLSKITDPAYRQMIVEVTDYT